MNQANQPAENQEVIYIQESADGGIVADLPPSIPVGDPEVPVDSDEEDHAAQQAEIAATGRVDPDAEAMREAKRLKRRSRKEYHKQVASEKDLKLQQLERQNRELLEKMANIERRVQQGDMEKLEKRIADEQNRIIFAKQKIKEAAETNNGELLVSAQDMLQQATKDFENLDGYRRRVAETPQQRQPVVVPNPEVQELAAQWLANNPWYDPQGRDPDSRKALNQDVTLEKDGYDPATPEYWAELDRRLQNIIPHRYTDSVDIEPRSSSRPRNVVTGSGRQIAPQGEARNQITLSREQVAAMKDAGMWDDPEKRAKMIRRYAIESRNIGNRS